jgi:hypothetical protein
MMRRDAVEEPNNSSGASDDWEMRIPPAPLNSTLSWILTAEAALSRRIPMPAGSSVLLVATKPR